MISYKKELKRETAVFRMVGIATFSRHFLVAVLLTAASVCAIPAIAETGGGYEGLIAPAAPDDTPDDSTANAVPDTIKEPTQQFSQIPRSQPSHDIKVLSMVHGMNKNADGVIEGLQGPKVDFSTASHRLVNGKQQTEYVIAKNIEHVMASVNDTKLSKDQRAENAKKGYKGLYILAEGLRSKQKIPDSTYKSMGFSDKYISDERSGNAAALDELDTALASLKPYQ